MKRKINIDRPELSSEEIATHADFSAIANAFSGGTGSILPWVSGFIAVTVLMTTLSFFPGKRIENSEITAESGVNESGVGNDELGVPKKRETIDPMQDNLITTPSGTEIHVPKGSIVDADGNPVTDDVQIVYREWFDPVEVALDDIPMQYDSAGNKHYFETAGMIEVLGYSGGQPVHIDPKNPINIRMRSPEAGKRFSLYELDTTSRDWTFLGVPEYEEVESALDMAQAYRDEMPEELVELEKEWKVEKMEVENLRNSAPQEPKQPSKGRYSFDLDIDPTEFPELKGFTNVTFEVAEGQNVDASIYHTEWDDIDLQTSTESNMYMITLMHGNRTEELLAYPVMTGQNLKKAMDVYTAEKARHDQKIKRAEVDEAKLRSEFETKVDEWRAEDKQYALDEAKRAEQHEAEKALNAKKNTRAAFDVVRSFNIRRFGTFNCDHPIFEERRPAEDELQTKFVEKRSGTVIKLGVLFLIESGRRALQRFNSRDIGGIKWNTEKQNVLFGLTTDGKIAKFVPRIGETIPKDATYYVFNMEISDEVFESPKEVKEYLGLEFDS